MNVQSARATNPEMCGIAGIWGARSGPDSAGAVAGMLRAMAHRGPDGTGSLAWSGGAAGMVRLALVDLSPRGQQPLWSPGRDVAILFNGEIYDFRVHRAALVARGYPFQSTTDSEVALALYLEHGVEFVHKLRGMYAMAIMDWRGRPKDSEPELVLVRDPLGIKPLYVADGPGQHGRLLFASELRALLASALVPRTLDLEAMAEYLGHGFVIQPRTAFASIRMLERGCLERHLPERRQASVRQRFWTMPPARPRDETLDAAAARLRVELEDSVRLHALADAPVGAFLSGGVDSTAMVALMRKHVSDLRTFTLGFPEAPELDESPRAAEIARRLDCHHRIVPITGRDVREALPRFAGELDQPSTDGLNSWLVCREAAREVKGVLSGLGGDEWFAGYPVARRMVRAEASRLQRVLGGLASQLERRLPRGLPLAARVHNLAARRSPAATWAQTHRVFAWREARAMLGLAPDHTAYEPELTAHLAEPGGASAESALGLACRLDAELYMGSQLLRDADAASMAHSLELRTPLVDIRIAEFSRSCADRHKLATAARPDPRYGPGASKLVLLRALADVLPADQHLQPKRGFALPTSHWLQREVKPLLDETCRAETLRARGIVDPAVVGRLGTGGVQPWSLMILELWARAVLDAVPSRQAAEPPRAASPA